MARSASASAESKHVTLAFATEAEVDAAYDTAKRVFDSGVTRSLKWRIRQLKNLRRMLVEEGEAIEKAIQLDLRRSE
jgi:acyl-CoA reductase-like NAD-dependent aldehyde dehydrogenase